MAETRVLIVDDSASYASLIRRALEGIAGVRVIGRAAGGRDALQRIQSEKPDLVTLDIEMPGMSGLDVLDALRKQGLKASVVVLSAAGTRGRDMTIQALGLGAMDFVPKPEGGTSDENLLTLRTRLAPLVDAANYRGQIRTILHGDSGSATPASKPKPRQGEDAGPSPVLPAPAVRQTRGRTAMVVIGASTGGTEALARVIPRLPGDLAVPVLIVQHMPPLFTQNLANSLNAKSALEVREAQNGETAEAGRGFIAPGGSHLKIAAGPLADIRLRVTSDPPENNCRPAVDYLFRSAAVAFPGRAVAVILTGMGRDGTLGLRLLKASGCYTIAQNEATCAVFGMPKEAIQAGVVDAVVPLEAIAAEIMHAIR